MAGAVTGGDAAWRLCVLLARATPGDPSREAARSLAGQPSLDWRRFLVLAVAHQVYPLVARRVEEWGLPAPRGVRAELRAARLLNAARARRLEEALGALLQLLASRGIPCRPFKGPGLARRLYGDPGLRHAEDLDLLVRAEDRDGVARLLRELRFREVERSRQGTAYAGELDGRRVVVDVQHRLAPPYLGMDDERLVRDLIAEPAGSGGGVTARELVALAVHLGRHRELLLKWVADVDAYLHGLGSARAPGAGPGGVAALAARYGARRFVEAALRAREACYGPAGPDQVAAGGAAAGGVGSGARATRSREAWLRRTWHVPLVTPEAQAWLPYLGKFLLVQSRWRMLGCLLLYPFLPPPDREGRGFFRDAVYRLRRERQRYGRQRAARARLLGGGREAGRREVVPG